MDFTIKKYIQLLDTLINARYEFQAFADFIEKSSKRGIILRHDVDDKKQNALVFAKIQADKGIRGTYYFRVVPKSYDREVIKEIASMGHEIGYHYETMHNCRGNIDKAYDEFCNNLEMFRELFPVKTICMHGSPLSRYDNRSIWKKYDYKDLGLIAEPYFDIDFNEVMYLTDTGRRWDGEKVSVRDKVVVNNEYRVSGIENRKNPQSLSLNTQNIKIHSTQDIINAASTNKLPSQIMLTFHPQRWTDKPIPWVKELVYQNAKNIIKRFLVK